MTMHETRPRIAILGAGPTGLEAALAAAEGAEPPDGAECPTGGELAERLFEPLAGLPEIAPHLRLGTRVLGIGREGLLKHEEIATAERGRRPFRLLLTDEPGQEWTETADLVIDATGSWGHPNTLGDGGIPAPGERGFGGEIRSDIPDFAREGPDWTGRTVLLAGAGHSAQTAARELARLAHEAPGTEVIWLLRNPEPGWGTHPGDPLPERAGLAATAEALAAGASPAVKVKRGAVVEEISKPNGRLHVVLRNGQGPETVKVDRILSLTGSVGNRDLYRQLQVHTSVTPPAGP
jgi:hypothetical protein